MNILVATNHLDSIGGTETFTYYLIKELIQLGHNIEYFTLKKGIISDMIESNLNVKFLSSKRYDLILANHNSTIEKIWKLGPVIQTCHGIYPYLEQPSVFADLYISISQEVQQFLAQKGINSTIIPNGINCDIFFPSKPIRNKLTSVLSLCQSEVANGKLKDACNAIGVEFKTYQDYGGKIWEIQDIINEVDLVIGLGRSAYDAMACGRPVIVYDERPYMEAVGDGYLLPVLTESFSKNCSGRYFQKKFDIEALIVELNEYKKKDGEQLRNFALNHLNIQKTTQMYLDTFYQYKHQLNFKKTVLLTLKNSTKYSKYLFYIFGKKIL